MSLLALDKVSFGYDKTQQVLHEVSFAVRKGVNVGLVGESGSGKSTILRLLLGLDIAGSGSITFSGQPLDPRDKSFMRGYRKSVQPVFQDPYSSLDPRQRVDRIIAEPLRSLRIAGDHDAAIAAALDAVGLPPDAAHRYPHAFSGGQRQRIAIARAIAPGPQVLLADEAVSALDLSTRVRIVDLLKTLSASLTVLLVSHDLGVVAALCEEIVILEKGRVVEAGRTSDILAHPRHPYTRKLLSSVPRLR
ncbi:ATP-binding cassette domain-containing protein [Pelagibacterium sp. 26DY04]|uniref:ABC transporter ATP-binding protein n=1 Tax=Pelagibacterium sp. 26DY04 TaxID=2967130 RepID=UPI0028156AAB|nr:ATP-binding cassette domain-containing protein [Pelagibacterium sp. 26DY04]WMT88504.1 ATP-binding cassette domain-containing protein [Pelagibacterium sp. 26DY04]